MRKHFLLQLLYLYFARLPRGWSIHQQNDSWSCVRLLTDTHTRQSVCSILQRSTWSWITVVATVVPRPFKCVWTSAEISADHCQEKSSWEKRKTRKQTGTSSLSFVDPHDSRTLTATSSSALHRCILAEEAVCPAIHYFKVHAECAPKRFANFGDRCWS